MRTCQYCAEDIQDEAIKCKHCGEMLTAAPTAPEPAAPTAPNSDSVLATRGSRLIAHFIDIAACLIALAPGGVLVIAGAASNNQGLNSMQVLGIIVGLLGVLCAVIVQIVLLARNGQTIGKRFLKLQIIDVATNAKPTAGKLIVLRYVIPAVIQVVPYVGTGFSLINALAIFRDDRKCLHDNIAGTKVIALSPR